jgi:uncharacterized membrane protein YgcG
MTTAALSSDFTAALISEVANAAASAAASSSSLSFTHQNINIKSLVPITLDMLSTSFRRWRNQFRIILGRFELLSHIDENSPRPTDAAWVQADLTVVMWIQATLADDLMDMVMEDKPTVYCVWKQICDFFNTNKDSRAVQLEAEFHGLQQGDLSASAYCHRLKTLSDALADCDQPLRPRALVHQLIAGLNPRYHTLKTLMPALPQFPSFIEARTMLIAEEASQNKTTPPATSETALIATEGAGSSVESPDARSESSGDRSGSTNNTNGRGGGRSSGSNGSRHNGRGHGKGRGGGRGNYNNNGYAYNNNGRAPLQQYMPNWAAFFPPGGPP